MTQGSGEAVLVTGGAGFIGSRLVRHLARRELPVRVLDRAPAEAPPGVDVVRGDILDADVLDGCLRGVRAVVHLAAETGVRHSMRDPARFHRANVLGTARLLQRMARAGTPRLVLASSSSVYGPTDGTPSSESDRLRPASVYGQTKVQAEALAASWQQAGGGVLITVRPFSVYGPGGRPDMAIPRWLQAARDGTPVEVYGDGSATRDFTFVDDVATLFATAIDAPVDGAVTVNGGAGRPHTLRRVLAAIEGVTGRSLQVVHGPERAGDVPRTEADPRRARAVLGWRAATRLEAGLRRTWRALQGRDAIVTERAL